MNKYNNFIRSLFKDKSVVYSATELNEMLCNKFSINSNYARQIIKRATVDGAIKSSEPFTFEKRQFYYMHPSQSVNLSTLKEVCRNYKKPLYRLLHLLEINEGIISLYEARKIASIPISNEDKYKAISLQEDLQKLKEGGFITYVRSHKTGEKFIVKKGLKHLSRKLIKKHQEKMKQDTVIIVDILRWLSNGNFITGMPIYRRKENPSIGAVLNDFIFDAYSFSKATGLSLDNNDEKDNKSTIVIMDILLYREYSEIDLHSFYDRIQSVRHSTKKGNRPRKVIPIVFYLDIEEHTKKQINNLHILHFPIELILGFKVRSVLKNMQTLGELIQENYNLSREDSIKVIKTVQNSLIDIEDSGHSDNLLNLKGDLFEALMFSIFTSMFPRATVEHSVLIKNPDEPEKQSYEYDIIVKSRDEIIIIELKGLKNTTIINLGSRKEKSTLSWFFGKTYPIAKKHYVSHSELEKGDIKGCYIASANFSKEALIKLSEYNNSKTKPNNLDCYYDRKTLLTLLKKHPELEDMRKSTAFIETIEKYYLTR